jgi:hypothetical protein
MSSIDGGVMLHNHAIGGGREHADLDMREMRDQGMEGRERYHHVTDLVVTQEEHLSYAVGIKRLVVPPAATSEEN